MWVVDGRHHEASQFWGAADGGENEINGAVVNEESGRDCGGVFGVAGVDGEMAGDGGGGDASGLEKIHEFGGGANHWGMSVWC